ncbi:apolipoprotein L3-like [Sorex araneus]|uniref:apolipoprotein L3-like n=1 Tax=Sorex araneus TaxID=42254 RepID=UPI002433C7DF|nr:apolipoprotein L3-like [Sorex araneus]
MNPEGHPGSCSIVGDAINYTQDTLSTEELQSLATDEDFLEKLNQLSWYFPRNWPGEEAECEDLRTQETPRAVEDTESHQQEQEYRERFLKEFPQVKKELEEHITQLRALADKAEKLHKDCAFYKLVASSTSIVSDILTIAGMGLAPVTAGVSLGLTVTGLGLGAASAVTDVATSIMEHASMAAIKVDANKLTSTGVNPEEAFKVVVCDCAPKIVPLGRNVIRRVEGIKKNLQAIKLVNANPLLEARVIRFLKTGRISTRNARRVQKAFGGTALAMSKGARLAGMATAGLFLLADVYSLVKQSVHLQAGAQPASASRLREQASELEMKLENLKEIHASLLED